MPQGSIFGTDDIKRQLLESNRDYYGKQTYMNAFQSNNLGAAQAQQQLKTDYSSAVNQAYSSHLSNSTAISNSNVIGASRLSLDEQNASALQEAYLNSLNGLESGAAQIEKQRQSGAVAVEGMLTEQANNIKSYADSHFDYLNNLYENDPALFESEQWSKYLTPEKDLEGNDTDKKRLMTREELTSSRLDEDGNELGLYDASGNLTLRGVDFFDQIENSPDLYDRSFGSFLGETDIDSLVFQGYTKSEAKQIAEERKDLLAWSQDRNDWNWTEGGTNKGSFRNMVGLDSTDNMYSFVERFGGLTEKEITAKYKNFDEAMKLLDYADPEQQVEGFRTVSDELFKMAKDLGIDGHLNEQGLGEESLTSIADAALQRIKSNGNLDANWWMETLTGVGVGAAAAGKMTAVVTAPANTVPLYGQAVNATATIIGALVGAIGGAVVSGESATATKNQKKEENKNNSELVKKNYLSLLTEMTKYSQQLRRQAEIDFVTKTLK